MIPSGADITFIKLFPDNKVYFGDWGPLAGIGKIATSDTELSEPCLMGVTDVSTWCAPTGLLGTDNEIGDLCTGSGLDNTNASCGLCGYCGTYISTYFKTYNDEVYVVSDSGSSDKQLWKYYPEVEFINLSIIKDVRLIKGLLSSLVIYGFSVSQQNKLIIYNISSDTETELLPDDDVEMYHINIRSDGKIWFDGLRFTDNKYVIGFVDTSNSNQVTFLSTTNQQLEDFQTF